jgi:hypothetical protein
MRRWRIALGTAGVLLVLFGVFRLATQIDGSDLVVLAVWLVAAVALHDGVLTPAVLAVSWVLAKLVPQRARRYVGGALLAGSLVTVIAIPLIYREGTQPKSKAILQQNYGGNLTLLLAIIAAVTLVLYAIKVVRDAKTHPSDSAEMPVET